MIEVNTNPQEVDIQVQSKDIAITDDSSSLVVNAPVESTDIIIEPKNVELVTEITNLDLIQEVNEVDIVTNIISLDIVEHPVFIPFTTITDGETTLNGISTIKFTGATVNRLNDNTGEVVIIPGDGEGGGTGSFNSPATTKGDLIVHGITEEDRLEVGANGYVLIADDTEPLGVKWGTVAGAGTNALTLEGEPADYYLDRTNHVGEIPAGVVTGLAVVATTNSYNSLNNRPVLGSASTKDAGTLAGEVLLLTQDNKLPALDGSLLTGIQSSFIVTNVSFTTTLAQTKSRIVFINSNTASFNITLPASPTEGDKIIFVDQVGSNINSPTGLGLNEVILVANTGHNIQGYSSVTLDDENTTIALVFNNSRWSIYHASY